MTEREHLAILLRNADVSIAIERENIVKAEARIEAIEGYKQTFSNRLSELDRAGSKS